MPPGSRKRYRIRGPTVHVDVLAELGEDDPGEVGLEGRIDVNTGMGLQAGSDTLLLARALQRKISELRDGVRGLDWSEHLEPRSTAPAGSLTRYEYRVPPGKGVQEIENRTKKTLVMRRVTQVVDRKHNHRLHPGEILDAFYIILGFNRQILVSGDLVYLRLPACNFLIDRFYPSGVFDICRHGAQRAAV